MGLGVEEVNILPCLICEIHSSIVTKKSRPRVRKRLLEGLPRDLTLPGDVPFLSHETFNFRGTPGSGFGTQERTRRGTTRVSSTSLYVCPDDSRSSLITYHPLSLLGSSSPTSVPNPDFFLPSLGREVTTDYVNTPSLPVLWL